MLDVPQVLEVESCSMRALAGGGGFAMDVVDGNRQTVRLQLPAWVMHQLMRALPGLDAAIHQRVDAASHALIGYGVRQWSVEPSGVEQGLALSLRNERAVDAAYHFGLDDAREFYRELGDAIARAALTPTT